MSDLEKWRQEITSGDPNRAAQAARQFAEFKSDPRHSFTFWVCDMFWNKITEIGEDLMEASGTDPQNDLGSATLKIKGSSPLVSIFQKCTKTMIGVIVETGGMRFPFYVDTFEYSFEHGAWTGTVNLLAIWDILNYLLIWPSWELPIQVQPFSHAVFFGPICTVLENMVTMQALRIQLGLNEFVNNALSLNPDIRAWFGTLLQSNGNLLTMVKTPIYVVRTNPFLDSSSLVVRTVRMETVGATIRDITRAYGVDVRVDLWLPGDEQPDIWTKTIPFLALTQPTYVVTVKDRTQIEGPTGTVLDSVLKTVVDLGGSLLGDLISPIIREVEGFNGFFEAPLLGVNFVEPWAIVIAPDPGQKGTVVSCKITDHTPKGWQHIIGGRSPRWLNNLINALLEWLVDAIQILIGITGFGNTFEGFLNNAFFAFQLIQLYERRNAVGPYHPCIEVFTATASPPYNIETVFQFINKFWDTRGYTSGRFTFRNGEPYILGKDIFRGGLVSMVYMNRTKILTDFIESIVWKISPTERDVFVQVGDGRAEEAPLSKHQRNITGAFEAYNVLTLAPQN
jgi:hypothetical protein